MTSNKRKCESRVMATPVDFYFGCLHCAPSSEWLQGRYLLLIISKFRLNLVFALFIILKKFKII